MQQDAHAVARHLCAGAVSLLAWPAAARRAHRRVLEVGRHLADGRCRLAHALARRGGRGGRHSLRRRARARQQRGASNGDTPRFFLTSATGSGTSSARVSRVSRVFSFSFSKRRACTCTGGARTAKSRLVRLWPTGAEKRPRGAPTRLHGGGHGLQLRVERGVGLIGRGAARGAALLKKGGWRRVSARPCGGGVYPPRWRLRVVDAAKRRGTHRPRDASRAQRLRRERSSSGGATRRRATRRRARRP